MYEKNCLNYGFITQLKHAKHVIVLQMHPSSQQEKAQLFEKIYAVDGDASIHTLHAHTLHTQDSPEINMLLTAVKGPSCVILCETYEKFVSLLQLFVKAKTTLPFTITGAKYLETMLNSSDLRVLANKVLQWDDILEVTHPTSFMVGSLHIHADGCECDPVHDSVNNSSLGEEKLSSLCS